MKRHASLVPLSRDHHAALILAQLLKKNAPAYTGLPTTITGKAEYALAFYETHLIKHFAQEEKMLQVLKIKGDAFKTLAAEIFSEHKRLSELFSRVKTATSQETVLNDLGVELDAHIRKEERVLFPLVEQSCNQDELKELALLFIEG
jgi:iron-sulfur cluster repair protein YtfE (RIC family)